MIFISKEVFDKFLTVWFARSSMSMFITSILVAGYGKLGFISVLLYVNSWI